MSGKIVIEFRIVPAKAIEQYKKLLSFKIYSDSGIAEVDDAKKRLAGLKIR